MSDEVATDEVGDDPLVCVWDGCDNAGQLWQNKEWMCEYHARQWSIDYETGPVEELTPPVVDYSDDLTPDFE